MYSFLILGQIPGTDLVINFTTWLGLAVLIAGAIALAIVRFNRVKEVFLLPTISSETSALEPLA